MRKEEVLKWLSFWWDPLDPYPRRAKFPYGKFHPISSYEDCRPAALD
jgi:hypothetical protein